MFLAICVLGVSTHAKTADPLSEKIRRFLPDRLAEFSAVNPIRTSLSDSTAEFDQDKTVQMAREEFGAFMIASRLYAARDGEELDVSVFECGAESQAYAFLTNKNVGEISYGDIGTGSRADRDVVVFAKGSTLVHIVPVGMALYYPPANTTNLARAIAELIDKGSGEIPSLANHLPEWEVAKKHPIYAVSLMTLKKAIPNQSVLDAISFERGTEAVAANYGPSQLLIVEFLTPQLAGDNDRNIRAKIQELLKEGKPAPTAYRRVGNYSVFVFNAPDAQTANQLIDQVKYEQVVQWLGNKPNWLQEAERRYVETTLGVFISVVKASGLAALLCFGIGGFFGALLFSRRRAQQAAAYSDAGGMTRLNLDEVDATKLLGPASR
jgi:hypothetical protein